MTYAAYAGSFDPLTNGHLHVIEVASRLFERLHVFVASNPSKSCTFSAGERLLMLQRAVADHGELANVVVEVVEGEFAARRAYELGCSFLVRGVRGAADLEAETTISNVNALAAPDVETLVLLAPKRLVDVSSSTVRGLVGLLGWRGVVRQMVPAVTMRALEELRFRQLTTDLTVSPQARDKMMVQYGQPHRAYHGLGHIVDCLEWYGLRAEGDRSLLFAILFHDAVYDPKAPAGENERTSAEMVREFYDDQRARLMIQATARHFDPTFAPTDYATQYMLDVDLVSLAEESDAERAHNTASIRQEYAHVPDGSFRIGRAKLLRQLLDKDRIYRTDFFYKRFEKRARANIAREIVQLWGAT